MFGGIGYDGHINEKLKSIIHTVPNFSYRPAFTVGRDATLSDLDSERIEKIYLGIKKEFGKKAANAFVVMVSRLKVATAHAFLIELYDLCNNNWRNKPKKQIRKQTGFSIGKDENGNYKESEIECAGLGIMETLFSNGRDQTPAIVGSFLNKYLKGYKGQEVFNEDGTVSYLYGW
jgi:hypothetical protein